jgi:hypothetical protein
MLVLILIFVAVMTGGPLLSTSFFRDANEFVWPALLIGVAAVGIFLAKAYQLYVKRDHRVRGLRRWLPTLLMLTCASLANGVLGYFLTLHLTMARIAGEFEKGGIYLLDWLVGSTATMILSLLVAILAALLWFLLMDKVKRIELAEAALMLEAPR